MEGGRQIRRATRFLTTTAERARNLRAELLRAAVFGRTIFRIESHGTCAGDDIQASNGGLRRDADGRKARGAVHGNRARQGDVGIVPRLQSRLSILSSGHDVSPRARASS